MAGRVAAVALCLLAAVVLSLEGASAGRAPAELTLLAATTGSAVAVPAGFKKVTCTLYDPKIGFTNSQGPGRTCGGPWYDAAECSKADRLFAGTLDICCAADPKGLGFGRNGEVDASKCIQTTKAGATACSKVAGYTQKICCLKAACKTS
jgi:hypothetical protein